MVRKKTLQQSLGVDTGGTFTDLVLAENGRLKVAKLPSTPADPAQAIVEGMAGLCGPGPARGLSIVHGTTVALNALLTGEVARTALVANSGLADLIEIGRQDRAELYALEPSKVRALVPRELRFEVGQRTWPAAEGGAKPGKPGSKGKSRSSGWVEVERPSARELDRLRARIAAAKPESIAICLVHSWADPAIEERVARALRPLGIPITTSSGLLREYREYERFSTAVVNAALVPMVRSYLANLQRAVGRASLSVLQSSGGSMDARRAGLEPARILLSGPAGGVIGAARAAAQLGFDRMVGIDMGGTSTDVSFHGAGGVKLDAPRIAGHPVALPALDLHTIGCGGGSWLTLDAGGEVRVGPRSAGASPGPVCYGKGQQLTLTDAHVLLGHLGQGSFLGGELALDGEAVERAFARWGCKTRAKRIERAQLALDVARSMMRRALGVMTMQRGENPAQLPLVAFGGAGGLHAAALAQSLGFACAILPKDAGVLSALGLALAPRARECSRSLLSPLSRWNERSLFALLSQLERVARRELELEGADAARAKIAYQLDLRYLGQSYEIGVRLRSARSSPSDARRAFELQHAQVYGHSLEATEVELVHARVRASLETSAERPKHVRAKPLAASAIAGQRSAVLDGHQPRLVRVIERSQLEPGMHWQGPAILQEYSATTLIPARWQARVSAGGHILLRRV